MRISIPVFYPIERAIFDEGNETIAHAKAPAKNFVGATIQQRSVKIQGVSVPDAPIRRDPNILLRKRFEKYDQRDRFYDTSLGFREHLDRNDELLVSCGRLIVDHSPYPATKYTFAVLAPALIQARND